MKGNAYEIFVRNYIHKVKGNDCYLWKDTPVRILVDCGYYKSYDDKRLQTQNRPDHGFDLIEILPNNKLNAIQCKCGYENGIYIDNLAGFFMLLANNPCFSGEVYYTTDKISRVLKHEKNKIKYTQLLFDFNIKDHCINPIKNNNYIANLNLYKEKLLPLEQIKIIARKYQIDAKNTVLKEFETENKAIITLPCGTGKTFISYLIAKNFKKIVIISPLRIFAHQNLNNFRYYGCKYKSLLVDMDGTRDEEYINKFCRKKEFIISSTFVSVELLSCINSLDDAIIIIDEFHNLSRKNVFDKNNSIYNLINSNNKCLFVSATPRIYELEGFSDDNSYNLGNIVYKKSFLSSVNEKLVVDYQLYYPVIYKIDEIIKDINTIVNIDHIENNIRVKCIYFFKCLEELGNRKCIVYCRNTDELNEIHDMLLLGNEFYSLDLNISIIKSDVLRSCRTKILNNFSTSEKREIILSIRILDECVDIPACDSIFITYTCTNKIRLVQRMCRSIRVDKNNKNKVAKIILWCNEYSDLMSILSGLKEYDETFLTKITPISTNIYYEQTIKEKLLIKNSIEIVNNYSVNVGKYNGISWITQLQDAKDYINKYNKKPTECSKDKNIKKLAKWIFFQFTTYSTKKYAMSNETLRNKWEEFAIEYKDYFVKNDENWVNILNEVKEYININKKRPIESTLNGKKLSTWIIRQNNNYKDNKFAMSDNSLRILWEEFKEEYKDYLLTSNEIWLRTLEEVKIYIDNNEKKPTESNKDKEIRRLGYWIVHQRTNYGAKKYIMSNPEFRTIWDKFILDYRDYFFSIEESWINTLGKVEQHMIMYEKKPSQKDLDPQIKKLGKWICVQKDYYKNFKYAMNNSSLRTTWEEFVTEYNI